jgi:hypothetical protein
MMAFCSMSIFVNSYVGSSNLENLPRITDCFSASVRGGLWPVYIKRDFCVAPCRTYNTMRTKLGSILTALHGVVRHGVTQKVMFRVSRH